MLETEYSLAPIGFLHSPLKQRKEVPNQGGEGAPDAWLEVSATVKGCRAIYSWVALSIGGQPAIYLWQ